MRHGEHYKIADSQSIRVPPSDELFNLYISVQTTFIFAGAKHLIYRKDETPFYSNMVLHKKKRVHTLH
jgi:hypothetical protein